MIEFRVQMEAPSTPNLREHHMARAKRMKKQRGQVARKMPKWTDGPLLHVRITRIASRELDKDNVQGAMKAIRDQVASGLRIDDATRIVEWHYEQAKGEAEVVVQIWRAKEEAPPLPVGNPVVRRLMPGTGESGNTKRPRLRTANPIAVRDVALPNGMRLRSPPTKGAKAGDPRYVEAHTPPRSNPVDAAKEAEETFAPLGVRLQSQEGEGCDNCEGIHPESCMFRSNH